VDFEKVGSYIQSIRLGEYLMAVSIVGASYQLFLNYKIMAKNKQFEAEYKAEGLRRSKIRTKERFNKYVLLANEKKNNHGHRIGESWADSNSPTGYSQVCSYQGICQSPCNGDC
jgi:hypothetical protein